MGIMVSLAVFSSLSLNLIFQFGLGIQGIADGQEQSRPIPLVQGLVLFIAVWALWLVSVYVLSPLAFGFLEYVLLFPLSALVCMGLETLGMRFFSRFVSNTRFFTAASAYNGLVLSALFLTLHIALTVLEALIMSLSFAVGTLFSILLLNEIRKRSALEQVPSFFKGKPLILISMGLLSLIFTSLTVVFFNMLGEF
jgi:electron transport complex protein RnfA